MLRALRNDGASGELGNGREGTMEKVRISSGERGWMNKAANAMSWPRAWAGECYFTCRRDPPIIPGPIALTWLFDSTWPHFRSQGPSESSRVRRGRKSKRQRDTDLSWFRHVLLFLFLLFSPLLLLFPLRLLFPLCRPLTAHTNSYMWCNN